MAVASLVEMHKGFRFRVAFLPRTSANHAADEAALRLVGADAMNYGVAAIESADGYRAIVTRALVVPGKGASEHDDATLAARLSQSSPRNGGGALLVTLLNNDGLPSRAFIARFTSWEWLPLRLDARNDDYALERVVLSGVTYVDLSNRA